MFKFIYSVTSRQAFRIIKKNTKINDTYNILNLISIQKFQFARKFILKRPQENVESKIVEKKNENVEMGSLIANIDTQ